MTTTKDCKDFAGEEAYYSKHHYRSRSEMLSSILLGDISDKVLIGVKPNTDDLYDLRFYEGSFVCARVIGREPWKSLAVILRGEQGLLCTIPFSKICCFVNLTDKYNITW